VARTYRFVILTVFCLLAAGLLLPANAEAQRRGGVRGSGVRGSGVRTAVVVRPSFYRAPRFYSPYYYYDPFFWGWGGFGYGLGYGYGYGYGYGPGYWQYPYPYYRGGFYDRTGAARLQVTPKETEVFVDGYYVGKADQFDGALQRLHVEAGEHELEFYLNGYKTAKQPVLFRTEGTVTVRLAMQPVAAGETSERPVPAEPTAGADRGQDQDPAGPPPVYRRPGNRMPPPPPQSGGARDDFGTLAIRVQPGDAEILIDGERWDGSDGGSRLSVQLSDGPHRVEVRKSGYRSYTANVRIRRGQTESLNVSLTQGDGPSTDR
jgi:hypothetical protein